MPVEQKQTAYPGVILAGLVLVILVALLATTLTAPTAATATSPGQVIFEQKCQACHTIGGGRTVGPDLKSVTERRETDWLLRFIVSPERLIAEDPIAQQLVQEYGIPMPNLGLSEQDAAEVLAYIEAQSGDEPSSPPPEQDNRGSTPALSGNAAMGKDIFTGKIPLQSGGIACLACHNVSGIGAPGGGTIGKDLTGAYAAFGEPGLISILKATPFPLMAEIYTDKPLTEDETTNLVAFLQEAGSGPAPAQSPRLFIIISVVGFLIIIGTFQLIWRGRLSGVRQSLVKGDSL